MKRETSKARRQRGDPAVAPATFAPLLDYKPDPVPDEPPGPAVVRQAGLDVPYPAPEATQRASFADAQDQPSEAELLQLSIAFFREPLAQRLALVWRACGGKEHAWLSMAGVSKKERDDAERICNALKLNGICLPGGVLHRSAEQYLRTLQARELQKGKKR